MAKANKVMMPALKHATKRLMKMSPFLKNLALKNVLIAKNTKAAKT